MLRAAAPPPLAAATNPTVTAQRLRVAQLQAQLDAMPQLGATAANPRPTKSAAHPDPTAGPPDLRGVSPNEVELYAIIVDDHIFPPGRFAILPESVLRINRIYLVTSGDDTTPEYLY